MRFPYLGYGGVRFAWKFEPRLNHVLLLAGDHMDRPYGLSWARYLYQLALGFSG